MPRHLISDAHEWMERDSQIPLSTIQRNHHSQGTGLAESAGKEDPVELDSSPTL
ncbi:hypothetical protein Fmac_033070 [Flemingia macrophylla]|uniref:Uncharacterized protein n=1 Tax=Flemingia macrophylla TaxID=520843 RepID=A0ABD1L6Q1_9FABA